MTLHFTFAWGRLSQGVVARLNGLSLELDSFRPRVIASREVNSLDCNNEIVRVTKRSLLIYFLYAVRIAILAHRKAGKERVVIRYSPTAIYLWPLYLSGVDVVVEIHGIPGEEVSHRRNSLVKRAVVEMELILLRSRKRDYIAVTDQIKKVVEKRLAPRSVLLLANPVSFKDSRKWAIEYLNRKEEIRDLRSKCKIDLLFLCSNLGQAWQGVDVLLAYLDNMFEDGFDTEVTLDIAGKNEQEADILRAREIEGRHEGLRIRFIGEQDERKVCSKEYLAGFAPMCLERKGLRSSASLKTRTYLRYGIPVISRYPDDAYVESFDKEVNSDSKARSFNIAPSSIILEKTISKLVKAREKYPRSYRIRVMLDGERHIGAQLLEQLEQ